MQNSIKFFFFRVSVQKWKEWRGAGGVLWRLSLKKLRDCSRNPLRHLFHRLRHPISRQLLRHFSPPHLIKDQFRTNNLKVSCLYRNLVCLVCGCWQIQHHAYQHTSIFRPNCDIELAYKTRFHRNLVHKCQRLSTDDELPCRVYRSLQSNGTILERLVHCHDRGRRCQ